jgi:hypothetical protein
MEKKLRIGMIAVFVLFLIDGFLPWKNGFTAGNITPHAMMGYKYFFLNALIWMAVFLFLLGIMGLLYFNQTRFAIFCEIIGVINLVLLMQDVFVNPQKDWHNLYHLGFPIGATLIAIELILVIIYHVQLIRDEERAK